LCNGENNVANRQKQLIDKYVELFNYRIERDLGRKFTNFSGSLMENALRKLVQEHLKSVSVNAEKCFVKDGNGKFTEYDIVIYRKGKENKELNENFNTLVVDSSDVVAIVEVKSFADATGFEQFTNSLKQCGLTERGYFVGITGSIKGVRGAGIKSKPRIFILAQYSYANIKKKQRMQRDKVKDNPSVLEQFLKTLQDEVNEFIKSF
jgi:co-chaperonin GroES (HSP10)